ncbi:NAD dependent epimerase/dehydratase family enzyme [Mycetocola sp. BIGb0189]|uniref:epimerase n=1 Tax=Mycetocola sp. BIGb0189 TaxID=2940604 RepID=UPI0021695F78|nr:DUF1731 domain-containing protein [Mycetocola sp. BIGb0189]MCS4276988.1 NAD dependent epimerase/dehydratase family enzyme [Mycetocola sp. BIGb0189]
MSAPKHVVLAGVSGFIGAHLDSYYRGLGARVSRIGRSGPDARWGEREKIAALLEGADLLINMAGKSVNCRYHEANRREILRSRVETTRELREIVASLKNPPPVWMNASTATIYRDARDRPMTESTGEIGSGFSVSIATAWEAEFFAGDLPGVRRVALRMAIVLGDGSALVPLTRLARLGIGGPQMDGRWPASRARLAAGTYHRFGGGGGTQKMSWVHIDDVISAIEFIRDHEELDGAINVSSPGTVTNAEFMRELRRSVGVPVEMPAFRWMIEPAMAVLRTESEMILKSRWVIPETLENAGFTFGYPTLAPALTQIATYRAIPA